MFHPNNSLYILASTVSKCTSNSERSKSINQSINQSIKFIISIARCRLDFTINSSIAYKFKNTSGILNVDTTEITIVDETRECLSRQSIHAGS